MSKMDDRQLRRNLKKYQITVGPIIGSDFISLLQSSEYIMDCKFKVILAFSINNNFSRQLLMKLMNIMNCIHLIYLFNKTSFSDTRPFVYEFIVLTVKIFLCQSNKHVSNKNITSMNYYICLSNFLHTRTYDYSHIYLSIIL